MDQTSPEFTEKELKYFRDTDFLKTKRLIIDRFIALFEDIQKDIIQSINDGAFQLPDSSITKSGKITKGENYKALPFVVLDCPRLFSADHIFAYRTMFWWGNYLSNHFLLKGHYLDRLREPFIDAWPVLKEQDVYLDLSDDPWNHDIFTDEFTQMSHLKREAFIKILQRPGFLKIVWYTELGQWKAFRQLSLKNFLNISKIISL